MTERGKNAARTTIRRVDGRLPPWSPRLEVPFLPPGGTGPARQVLAAPTLGNQLLQMAAASDEAVAILTPDGALAFANTAFEALHDYQPGGLNGRHESLLTADEHARGRLDEALATARRFGYWEGPIDYRLPGGDRLPAYVWLSSVGNQRVGPDYLVETKRRRTGEGEPPSEARKAHRRLAQIQNIVPGVLYVCRHEPGWTMQWISEDIADLVGFSPEALVDNRERSFSELIHPEDRDRVLEAIEQALEAGETFQIQYRLLARDGSERLVWEKGRTIGEDSDGVALLEGYIADLSESRETQQRLAASEARFRQLFNGLADAAFVQEVREDGLPGRLVEVNDAACEWLGYSRAELLEMTAEQLGLTRGRERAESGDVRDTGQGVMEVELAGRDGTALPVELRAQSMAIAGEPLLLFIARDMREEKARQRLLQRTNRAMGILSHTNQTIVHSPDPETLLQRVVEGLQRNAEYALVWAAFVEETPSGPRLRGIAARGQAVGLVERADFLESPAGTPASNAVATAYREGRRAVVVLDGESAGEAGSWLDGLRASGIRSLCVLPWRHQDGTGLLGLASNDPEAFAHTGELEVLEEAAVDMGFGMAALQTREELHREVARREQSLESTIHSMGRSLEERDPYTAGHQERVGELAVALGEELGLEADRVLGLRLGAWIHDIGKVKVPMDILNKPGNLTESEFGVIKEHPEVGNRILGDIEFRWPIRDMVRHHHERLDGSGYPAGLTAESLSLEVRILAVADTVEAITSHRPYRPGRGVERALAVLREDRGTRLDADVVDACLSLFQEGRFEWSGGHGG